MSLLLTRTLEIKPFWINISLVNTHKWATFQNSSLKTSSKINRKLKKYPIKMIKFVLFQWKLIWFYCGFQAFWFTQDKGDYDGDVFGSSDQWVGLGVFFDSFDNDNKHNNPYIMAIVNDGTRKYDHLKYECNKTINLIFCHVRKLLRF